MKMGFKSIIKYIVALTGVISILSLILMPFGMWTFFGIGLLCGAVVAIAGFALTYLFTERAAKSGRKGAAFAGIGLKFILYLGVMAGMTITFGLWAGVGTAAGCFTGPLAIIASAVIVPGIKRKVSAMRGSAGVGAESDREYVYEEHIRARDGSLRYLFLRGAYLQSYSGGRSYVTHRRFRKLKEIRVKNASDNDHGKGVPAQG
jgi:hypothetical protein